MGELALITVEIRLLSENTTIGIGGPPDEARAMCCRLANVMGIMPPEYGILVDLQLDWDAVEALVIPVLLEFTGMGWCFIHENRPRNEAWFA